MGSRTILSIMTLSPGSRLGPYEIVGPLGAGGMGEVYRARDTRLDRIVAVKILPAHLADKPAARERFEREARTISSLNHPNICHLYDVGSQDGIGFLVMEYLEGSTLADLLRKGPLPLDQVLKHSLDICEGLEKAHQAGVLHRDLKPGNIMITKLGAKLMDFGLAKPLGGGSGTGSSALLTVSSPLTAEGMVIGTFQYMSPEQVEGKEAMRESDLFSLGAILYEMVTGRRAFEGKSQLSVASAILEKEPEPIVALRPMTPPILDHVIRTCLAKDPERRWQTARDLSHALRGIGEGGSRAQEAAPARRRSGLRLTLVAALAVAALAVVALGLQNLRPSPASATVTRTYVKAMPESSFMLSDGAGFALSPDGLALAYVGTAANGRSLLWYRPMDSLEARPLAGTEGATYPFWSPDGRSLGFFAAGKLKTIEILGGRLATLIDAPDARGGAWSRQGDIVFTPSVTSALFRIPASGGAATAVTDLDPSKGEISHRWPFFLPDGRHFLFLAGSVFTPRENPTNRILIGSLDAKETTPLLRSHAGAAYASGMLLFLQSNTLMAQPFDPTILKPTGAAVPVADPVREAAFFSRGLFTAAENGLLAYVEGVPVADRVLAWFDRHGGPIGTVPEADGYASPRISPDGKRLAYHLEATGYDIWTYDNVRGVKSPLTFGSESRQQSFFPIWSPDSSRIAYTAFRGGRYFLEQKAADGSSGSEVLLDGGEGYRFPSDWSPDGRFLAYQEASPGGHAIWMLPLEGERKPYRFLNSPASNREAVFSPDGRWVAYSSNETGAYSVYVVPFPGPGGTWLVSPGGGSSPRWRGDGKELFYLSASNEVMSVDITTSDSVVEMGAARKLFEVRAYGTFGRFDVSRDGQRFVVSYEPGEPSTSIALITNWPTTLRR